MNFSKMLLTNSPSRIGLDGQAKKGRNLVKIFVLTFTTRSILTFDSLKIQIFLKVENLVFSSSTSCQSFQKTRKKAILMS